MKLKKFTLVVANLLFLFASVASAQSIFDLTFGSGGKIVSSPNGSEANRGLAYALQTDGKIVAVGGGSTSFLVARYNANGSLDTTFGTNGWSSITFADYTTSASAVDIQPDGKIVVGGNGSKTVNNQFTVDFLIARFNADGSVDTTFDGDGRTTVSFVPEVINLPMIATETFRTLKVTSDGKIIVGGSAGVPGPGGYSRFAFAKFNADGSLDTTFGTGGKNLGVQGFMYLNDMTVLADGSFVGVGSEVNDLCRLAYKYHTNGAFHWSYQMCETLPSGNGLHGIAQQPDGKLVMVGNRRGRLYALRLDDLGREDSTFVAPTSPNGRLNSVAVMPDGKIVATLNLFGFNVIRYNSDGNFDTSFGNGAILTAAVSGGTDFPNKILAQPDGKILVGGYSELSNPSRNYFSMMRLSGIGATSRPTFFDYDGDRKADVSVYRPSAGTWFSNNSTSGFSATAFGISTDVIVPADYDGEGKTDVAVFRNGMWYVLRSFDNSFSAVSFGQTGDIPVPADYDGDGRTDIAVYRGGTWYLNRSTLGFAVVSFGLAEDKPTVGDYDGDGKADISVYRSSTGTWYRINSFNGSVTGISFGLSDDIPVPADYDGDGRTDISVYRPSRGDWFRYNSSNNAFSAIQFGISEDKLAPADYDGDGKIDIAVFRPSTGTWYLLRSASGFGAINWGISSDTPTPNAYIR